MKKRHYLTESDLQKIRHMIEVEHLQQWKVADEIGVHLGTIEQVCKRLDLKTGRTGPKSGSEHPDWKGGRTLHKGYWYVYSPDHPNPGKKPHYVLESHLVMENKLGRYLLSGEVVHHLDSNPQNNAPENLIVFGSNAAHLKAELTGRRPKWTPEGRQRTLDGIERWRQERRRIGNVHQNKESDDGPQPQPIDHPTT